MQRKLIGILSLLFSSFLFAVPASAVDLPLCAAPDGTTHFTLVGQDQVIFEISGIPRTIEGNVMATAPNGFVRIGKNVNITGTVIANRIEFHSSGTATAGECVANVITGPAGPGSGASCAAHANNGGFDAFEAAHPTCTRSFANDPAAPLFQNLCGTAFTGDACANAAAPLVVAEGDTLTLIAGGCFGALTLNKGSVLNLTGTYTFKTVTMKAGSKLNGPANGIATVNVNGQFLTEPGVFITNIKLNVAASQGDVVAIFNNSILTNSVINAPFGRCHPHTGTLLAECTEMCCKSLDVEPIDAQCGTPGDVCVCRQGFKFELNPQVPVFNQSPIDARARNCVPCQAGDGPPAFPTCP